MLPLATQNKSKMKSKIHEHKKLNIMKVSKKIILAIALVTTVLFACNTKNNKSAETTATDNQNQLYACSMHPEVTGKKGEECSKCGMELTEPVKEKK
jgi:formamidopyrimidine-DNA glycosylase